MRLALSALITLAAVMTAGCNGGDDGTLVLAPDRNCEDDHDYTVFEDPEWRFMEAVDYPTDLGELGELFPGLDWYAEYQRTVPVAGSNAERGLHLSISRYQLGLDDYVAELKGVDDAVEQIEGQRIYVGAAVGNSPSVVAIPIDAESTIEIMGSPAAAELIDVARELEPVCQPEWVGAGGQVLDCLPWEPGCAQRLGTTPLSP